MKSNKKACCFSSGIYQFYPASLATLTWPHLAWPPPHITLGAALDNNNLIRPISRCGQGEIIVVIALLHSPVIAFVYHRTMPRPQQPVSGRPGSRAAQYRAGDVWMWGKWGTCAGKMLCVQYFKNFLQHGPTESTRVKCRQFQCRVIFIYDVKVGGEKSSHASLGGG